MKERQQRGGLVAGMVRRVCKLEKPAHQPAKMLGCPGLDCSSRSFYVWEGEMEMSGVALFSNSCGWATTQENDGDENGVQEPRKN